MALPYNGQLNTNVVITSLRNMIISQRTFDYQVATPTLADMFRVDGTMYGDTKLYNSLDIGGMQQWASQEHNLSPDRLAPNLLELHRNHSAVTQSIQMGEYFWCGITTDQYMSKMAFMGEGTFSEFIGVLKAQLTKIKKVYDNALINGFIGTQVSDADACNIEITPATGGTTEENDRRTAQLIARQLAVLKADLNDNTRKYNELGYLRSYDSSNLVAVWNVEQSSKITMVDLPSLFHIEGVDATKKFKQVELTSRWFGDVNTEDTVASDTVRASVTGYYDVSDTVASFVVDYAMATSETKAKCVLIYQGDNLPSVGAYEDKPRGITVNVVSTTFPANYSYTENPNILFKLVDKESIPFMSGFQTGTEFWNALSLTNNNYLMFGHNKLERLKELPFITVSLAS